MIQHVLSFGRQVAIAVVGGALVLVGIVLCLVPGLPGVPVILLGLGILSLEFEQPRALLARIKAWAVGLKARFAERRARSRGNP